jgi:hypothetical protein
MSEVVLYQPSGSLAANAAEAVFPALVAGAATRLGKRPDHAAHESRRTTKLYGRTADVITFDERITATNIDLGLMT